jgi:hypothetical protein
MFSHIKTLSDKMTAYGVEVTNGAAQGTSNLVVDFSPRPVSDSDAYVTCGRTVHPNATYMLVLFCSDDDSAIADQIELEFIEWLRTIVKVNSVLHQRQTDDYARQTYVEVVLPYELV